MAVFTKLHLDKPRAEGTDRQDLLQFYDEFGHLPKFKSILPKHFKQVPHHEPKRAPKKTVSATRQLEFGVLEDELGYTPSDETMSGSEDEPEPDPS